MNHDRFEEWLYLSVYGELGGDERNQLDQHLRECDGCRLEHEKLIRMLEAISRGGTAEPTEEALTGARKNLSAALAKERRPFSPLPRREPVLTRWLGKGGAGARGAGWGSWLRGYRIALAGAATLSLGFLIGYLAFGGAGPIPPGTQPRLVANGPYTSVADVHILDADATDGEVELLYELVTPRRLKAGMDDARVRRLLAHAILNGGNPGVRLDAINALESSGKPAPAGDVKQALLGALVSDPNAGVRRRAMEFLQKLPFDEDIKSALIFVLAHDENPGLRVAAMNYLSAFAVDGDIPEKEYRDILDAGRETGRDSRLLNRPETYH